MGYRKGSLNLILIMGIVAGAWAGTENPKNNKAPKNYQVHPIKGKAPEIDGQFNDPAWQQIEWHDHFVQIEPYEGQKPSEKTRFKMVNDNDYLYIALRGYDSHPDSIVERLSRRDNMEGDRMGVQIDSYHDNRTAFCFFVTAAGVKIDWIITDDGMSTNYNWDPVWHVETSTDSLGWKAEMKIPFAQLRFSKKGSQKWGLQIKRTIYREDEKLLWKLIPRDASGWVSQFGDMNLSQQIEPQKERAITPYTVANLETFRQQPANPFAASGRRKHLDAGLNAKVGLTNNITLDMAINPDFGQVEADPSKVNLTAYETYFEEKRPFFIEGQSIMDFRLMQMGNFMNDNLFYSRRIGGAPHYTPSTGPKEYARTPDNTSILGALKLTGKTRNGWSVGVLESMTAREQASIAANHQTHHQTVEPLTNYFLGRAQKSFNQGQTLLGGIMTATHRQINADHLQFLHDQAYTGGINFKHRWNERSYNLSFRGIFSHVRGSETAITRTQSSSARYYQRPDASYLQVDSSRNTLSGHGGSLMFTKMGKGHFRYGLFLNWKSPGLELNDMGYQREADQISQLGWAQYRIYEPFSIFQGLRFNLNQWRIWNYHGQHLFTGGNVNINTQFKNYWEWGMGLNGQSSSYSKSALRGGPMLKEPARLRYWAELETDPRKKLAFTLGNNQSWSRYHHSHRNTFWGEVSFRPHNTLQMSLSPSLSIRKDELQYVTTTTHHSENHYIMASIDRKTLSLSFRLNFSITPELSLQYWGQPFIASGDYHTFKKVTDPVASAYHKRFHTFTGQQLNHRDKAYHVDENRDGATDYTFANPDFNLRQFKSNLVARWQYLPGSTLYLVWSQNRNGFQPNSQFNWQNEMHQLFNLYPENVFLIKLTYRLGL
mgnify:CR=1 FL=1